MGMHMEQSPEFEIAQLQSDVDQIRNDLDELHGFITGNGDPTKGLLWLAADLSRLVTAQSKLTEANRQVAVEEHRMLRESVERHVTQEGIHIDRRRSSWQERMAFAIAEKTATVLVTFLLVALFIGLTSPRLLEILRSPGVLQ